MLDRFGQAYQDYLERVPMFFPRRGEWNRLVTALRDSLFPAWLHQRSGRGNAERSGGKAGMSPASRWLNVLIRQE